MSETETFNQASFGETTNLDHHQRALVAAFSGFIFYLLIPKGIRKHFFDALPRRYAKTRNRRKKRKSKVRWSDAKSSRDSWMYAEHANKDCFLPSHANLLLDPSGCSAPPLDSPITAASMCSSYHRGLLSPKSMTQNNHHCTEKTPLLSNTKRRIAQRVSATPLSNQTSNSSRQSSPQSVASLMDRTEPTRVLLLLSSKLDDADQIQHQREAQELLQDRGVPFETADADDPINRDR